MIALGDPLFAFRVPIAGVPKGRAKSRIITGKHGKNAGKTFVSHYTPASTRSFEATVAMLAKAAMLKAGTKLSNAPIDLIVEFRFAIPPSWPKWKVQMAHAGMVQHTTKPDCSNLVKAVEDACNKILFEDDGQIVGSITDKRYTIGDECVMVYGYRRAGISAQASKAEAIEIMARLGSGERMDNHPLGQRLRAFADDASRSDAPPPPEPQYQCATCCDRGMVIGTSPIFGHALDKPGAEPCPAVGCAYRIDTTEPWWQRNPPPNCRCVIEPVHPPKEGSTMTETTETTTAETPTPPAAPASVAMIELTPEQSTRLHSVGYDRASKTLTVRFSGNKREPTALYRYAHVEPALFADMMEAPALGTFFRREIKANPEAFPYICLEKKPGEPYQA